MHSGPPQPPTGASKPGYPSVPYSTPQVGTTNPVHTQMNASNMMPSGMSHAGVPGMNYTNLPSHPAMVPPVQNTPSSIPTAQMAQMRLSNGSQQHPAMPAPGGIPPGVNSSVPSQVSQTEVQPAMNSGNIRPPSYQIPPGVNTSASTGTLHQNINAGQVQPTQHNMAPPNSSQMQPGMSVPSPHPSISGMPVTSQPLSQGMLPPATSGMPAMPYGGQPSHPGMPSAVQNGPAAGLPMGMPNAIPQQTGFGAPNTAPPGMYVPGTMPPGMATPGAMPGLPTPPGMLAPGMPTPGMPTPGMPAPGMPAPGMPTPGMPMPGFGMPGPGMPGPGMAGSPGMGAPGMPGRPVMPGGGFMNEQRPRLDPNAMPSVIQVVEDDRSSRTGMFPTGYPTAEPPPLVTTTFVAQDQGNCNPKFMRSTLYAVPQNQDMIKQSQIPFSVAISPFADILPNEKRPPVVDLGELGPVRCQRCKAYICAFMEFQDGGRRFRCPFCNSSTTVEELYFCHVDHNGRRTDIQYRPELYLGSYEFVATKPYCKNGVPPKKPAFIFMLDVSYNSIRSGVVSSFCENLVSILQNLPVDEGNERSEVQIGLVTYDQCIHFYNLMNPSGQPEMLVVNDVEDVFVPFIDGFLVPFEKALPALTACLEQIVVMFNDTRITESILGPVVQAGLDALKCSDRAGKLFIFHSSLPIFDAPGKLKNREDRKVLGSDKEKTVLSPANDFYTKLGEECYFDQQKDAQRFLSDLRRDVSRNIAFDVMMRVRTSTGIRPTGFYGSFYMQNTVDMEFGCID
uniref:Protein transport protein Sec24C n=1 Tax=Steinernema glaseri TaxID=37863 RepID=A0A1I7YG39_9BILA